MGLCAASYITYVIIIIMYRTRVQVRRQAGTQARRHAGTQGTQRARKKDKYAQRLHIPVAPCACSSVKNRDRQTIKRRRRVCDDAFAAKDVARACEHISSHRSEEACSPQRKARPAWKALGREDGLCA